MTAPGKPFQPYRLVTSTIRQSPDWYGRIRPDTALAPNTWRDGRPARRHPTESPLAGAYKLRLAKGAPWMPARIWIVEHRCPESKKLMADVEYQAERGDEGGIVRLGMLPNTTLRPPRDVWALWDWHGLEVCPWDEFDFLVAMLRHANTRESDLAEADPYRPVDRLRQPTIL